MKLLLVFFFLPMIVALLLNLINNKEDIGTEVKYIFIFIHKMFWVFFLVFFLKFFFDNPSSANNTKGILFNLLYHWAFWSFVIFINYFSTRYIEFKSCIKILSSLYPNLTCSKETSPLGLSNLIEVPLSCISSSSCKNSNTLSTAANAD